MIYFILNSSWIRYQTGSPCYNFIHDKDVLEADGSCEIFVISDAKDYLEVQKKIEENKPKAIVCEETTYKNFTSFTGIRLLLLNDIHCFCSENEGIYAGVHSLQAALDWSTASLTGYMFSLKKPQQYFYPKDPSKYVYFPHHVSCLPIPINDFDSRAEELLVVGALSDLVYPMRTYASTLPFAHRPASPTSREEFIPTISKYKRAFTCNSWLGYTVAKYFEIPKAGTVLIGTDMDTEYERELLGFKNGDNCVLVKSNEDLLHLPEATKGMAERGYELIMARHTTKNRLFQLKTLVDMFENGACVQECVASAYLKSFATHAVPEMDET